MHGTQYDVLDRRARVIEGQIVPAGITAAKAITEFRYDGNDNPTSIIRLIEKGTGNADEIEAGDATVVTKQELWAQNLVGITCGDDCWLVVTRAFLPESDTRS